jgi:hypothetical protein
MGERHIMTHTCRPLLKSAEKSNSQAMLELMNNFTPKSPVRGQVKHKALTRLVSLLVKSFSPSECVYKLT